MRTHGVKIGVSACLLGENVRYDGGNKKQSYLTAKLANFATLVPMCPEAECGLGIPREKMHLVGSTEPYRLIRISSQQDMTNQLLRWVEDKLRMLEMESLDGFIFKSKSPSCGLDNVKVYDPDKHIECPVGMGIFAAAFQKRFPNLPVVDEIQLGYAEKRQLFLSQLDIPFTERHNLI